MNMDLDQDGVLLLVREQVMLQLSYVCIFQDHTSVIVILRAYRTILSLQTFSSRVRAVSWMSHNEREREYTLSTYYN